MIRMFRITVPALAAIALAGAAALGCANRTEQTEEDRMVELLDQRVEAVLDEIEATDAQRERVHELKDDLLVEVKRARQDHQQTRKIVEEMWLQEAPDEQKAHALVDQRIDALRKTAHQVTDAALELHQILTPEQRRLLAEKAKERRRHWQHRWHGGGLE